MGCKKQIDTSMYFCPYPDCSNHGKVGPDNQIIGAGCYGKHQTQLLKCKVCNRTFSERRGTPLFNLKASEGTFYDVIACLTEGNGIRATARIKKVDKDTVATWLDKASQHVEAVSRYLMVNLHFEEAQLDEFWSFVKKKEAHCTALEKLQTEYGDHWVWMSFDPVHKIIPAFVTGEISQERADQLLERTKEVNDGSLHVFFSDQRPQYREAILKSFGQWVQPKRKGTRGPFPKPRLEPPADLLYAQVVKHRRKGRVVKVTEKVIFGTQEALQAYLEQSPVSKRINTAFVERQNNTMRQHNRRFTRKTLGFSKDDYWLERQVHLSVSYYHFCLPHGGLREEIFPPIPTKGSGSPKKWRQVTPMMSAGVTDHIWTVQELLTYRLPPDAHVGISCAKLRS